MDQRQFFCFLELTRKHLFITTCIEKHWTWLFNMWQWEC